MWPGSSATPAQYWSPPGNTCNATANRANLGELPAHNCLYYPRGTDQPAWTFERGRHKDVERLTVPIAGSFATNNSEALRDSALNHLGIALLPDFSAHAALASGKLVQVLKDWTLKGAFADEIYLIRPYSPHVPKSVTALVDYLKQKLAGGFRTA